MGTLRFLTAGESHGKGLVAIMEGMVADLPLEERHIDRELRRRQQGYGRGPRMKIEQRLWQVFAMGSLPAAPSHCLSPTVIGKTGSKS